jgi:hypothetical protein
MVVLTERDNTDMTDTDVTINYMLQPDDYCWSTVDQKKKEKTNVI